MCIHIRSINYIIFSIMKNTEYKGHINEHVMAHLNIKPKRKIQWDVVLFYLFIISFSIYIADNIIDDGIITILCIDCGMSHVSSISSAVIGLIQSFIKSSSAILIAW